MRRAHGCGFRINTIVRILDGGGRPILGADGRFGKIRACLFRRNRTSADFERPTSAHRRDIARTAHGARIPSDYRDYAPGVSQRPNSQRRNFAKKSHVADIACGSGNNVRGDWRDLRDMGLLTSVSEEDADYQNARTKCAAPWRRRKSRSYPPIITPRES